MNEIKPTTFLNVQVIAIPIDGGDPNKPKYKTTFIPPSITVVDKDTVINYQIISPTPADVKFSGMKVNPKHTHQLSIPSVSRSGKLITFSNANTVKEVLNITLNFTTKESIEFEVDPEVINNPDI